MKQVSLPNLWNRELRGHTVADGKIYQKGFLGFIEDIKKSLKNIDYLNDPSAYDKQEELKAMMICARAIIGFAHRHAEKAREMASAEKGFLKKKRIA